MHTIWQTQVRNKFDEVTYDSGYKTNLRTTSADPRSCLDWEAYIFTGSFNTGETGTSTGTSAISLTNTGATFPTTNGGYQNHIVVVGSVYGVITSNTGTVLTVDRWNVPGNVGGSAGSTPGATSVYTILPGQAPFWYIALSTDSTAPSASDVTLAGEITNSDLKRAVWTTLSHTSGATTFFQQKTFTAANSYTVQKMALFTAASAGAMPIETALSSPPVLVSGDTLQITSTISY